MRSGAPSSWRRRVGRRAWGAATVVAAALAVAPGVGRADAVDEAYASGHAAAADGQWADAILELERTRSLLPAPNAALEYDLGTAYAQDNRLGDAVWHLRVALRLAEEDALREAARRNLYVVQRRVDLRAETSGARGSRFDGWQSRVRRLLFADVTRWLTLAIGTAWGISLFLQSWIPRFAHGRRSGIRVVTWTLGLVFMTLSAASWLSAGGSPEAVVRGDAVEVREGAGAHHSRSFLVQGGSVVRVMGQAPGWRQIRLEEGLKGWIPKDRLVDAQASPGASDSR